MGTEVLAARRDILNEVDLVERFTRSYRAQVNGLIQRLNAPNLIDDRRSIRWCVEAVDMMLASHAEFAHAIATLVHKDTTVRESRI